MTIEAKMSRIAVIYNPLAGRRSQSIQRHHVDRLLPKGWTLEWFDTTIHKLTPIHLKVLLNKRFDLVLIAGGDGTVMACASALQGTGIPLGILPRGTGNVFASSLGIPSELPRAIEVALTGNRRHIDIGFANGRPFVLIAGIGPDAAIFAKTNSKIKARVGALAYLIGARVLLSVQRDTFEIEINENNPIRRRAYGVMVGNISRFRGVRRKWPNAAADDGQFEVAILRLHPAIGFILPADGPSIEWFLARQVVIRSNRLHPIERDGELDDPSRCLNVRVVSRSLTICVPKSVRVRPWITVFSTLRKN
jgi:YegS/Rv2252/BmrU family lipid kinase